MSTFTGRRDKRGVGTGAARPDGIPKVTGEFAYSSDLWAAGMLWGATLRSPHPHARIVSIDTTAALAMPGVRAVLTADDVPGRPTYGLEVPDQPVFASDVVRYVGEPIAAVAADHYDLARRAAAAIVVTYDVLDPLLDPEAARTAEPLHPDGNVFRHMVIRHGDPDATGAVVVEGTYEVGMQDQAPLGTESGLATPTADGGVELRIGTQWLHVDRDQIAASLELDPELVRVSLAGVGGAFGAREDVSLQIHLCLLARRTGRPVKMVYGREESFLGHVHRHPARMWFRHTADADGTLVKVEAALLFDGGAYCSSSPAVLGNATCFAAGPYKVPNAVVEGWAVRTNNPPCGAMRGFGSVQVCFGHEAQMDKLAIALGMDPVALRLKNALEPGDRLITGQRIDGAAPVRALIEAVAASPLPADNPGGMALPGGPGRTTQVGDVRRGVALAVGFKNLMFSEGFDDSAAAKIHLADGVATVTTACAEVGQGFVTLVHQIVNEVLGDDVEVVLATPSTTDVGSAGSTSASRQTWMSGGAVKLAADDIKAQVDADPGRAEYLADVVHQHTPTTPLDADGQGEPHVSFTFACHRAVVDVDPELGVLRLVDFVTSQEVGKILNPVQLLGQLEGGAAQGAGLALMEEIVLDGGHIKNPSFTDYLIPTSFDLPELRVAAIIEEPEPHLGAPFGAKGVGEAPTISSGAAVVAAIRNATGLELPRVPVRPSDIAFS
ncbi:MAG: Xanthine dehydrogenase, molybdenum binding subunit [Actinomycetia bacterium]|nr:Xanthine dehydrogenase, molybdenum binding subunit [Actinomycetes bacterium]